MKNKNRTKKSSKYIPIKDEGHQQPSPALAMISFVFLDGSLVMVPNR